MFYFFLKPQPIFKKYCATISFIFVYSEEILEFMTEVVYSKIIQYLENKNLEYQVLDHNPVASAEEYQKVMGTRYEQQAKALLLRYKNSDQKGFIVVSVQAQKTVNLEQLKELLGVKVLKMAQKGQLVSETGCNFGELPPLGSIFGLPLMMDKDLLGEELIYFNAGLLTKSIVMNPISIKEIEEPQLF